ncbi:cation-translocating P-type ATPase [Methanosphaera sp. ISO3-F5]|uniref:heavy metal translocating P-type ATPase n=1 Tax=Methanosphaera sp. ISO3-F5 TaxID=1452353 RepID=UPI002B259252|nr:cation-translocating P-type ATPase [Methanosphaera sp. ISO3-F5]WQH63574.1 cation-translocating P-type ATPase [Methanosphaera sp. ISO3-F5]
MQITKIIKTLEGLKMTIIGGIFLLMSLILVLTGTSVPIYLDPAWMTIIICGIPLVYLALTRLIYEHWVSSALLIVMAMVASIFIGEIFAAGEVCFIMALGALLEDYIVERSKQGLKDLINLKPQQGRLIINNNGETQEKIVKAEEIKINDYLRVLPGEVIPVDGTIITGDTSVDQSIMTGESLPLDRTVGDELFAGTLNLYGAIDIKATKVGKDSSLEKLIRMVEEADEKQAPTQRIADKWATWLVPIALLIAIGAYVVTWNIERAVTILVVFCPCALILATPTAIMAAIGQATKQGVLIKSGQALETMGNVDTITFDKTGTLTYGNLEVSDIISFDNKISEQELLKQVTISEVKSEHPIGKAIVNHAKKEGYTYNDPDEFTMIPGKGVKAVYKNNTIYSGTIKFMNENNMQITKEETEKLDKLRNEGKVSIIVALNEKIIGIIGLSDVLRENAKPVVNSLENDLNTSVELLTGDNHKAANYFANKIGIKNIHSELLPENKVELVEELRNSGKTVCMVGDGVNDAPALKTANVSVAMGGMGSDIAIEAADIALLGDDIEKLPYLKKLSNSTLFIIHLSITISMMINAVAIICSVLGWLNPITGALVHNIGSCAVVLLAASLYNRDFSDYIKKSKADTKIEYEKPKQSHTVASVATVFDE